MELGSVLLMVGIVVVMSLWEVASISKDVAMLQGCNDQYKHYTQDPTYKNMGQLRKEIYKC